MKIYTQVERLDYLLGLKKFNEKEFNTLRGKDDIHY